MLHNYHTVNILDPVDGRTINRSRYWLCKDGDPKQAVFFGASPQANRHKSITERFLPMTEEKTGWILSIVFLDFAYVPSNV